MSDIVQRDHYQELIAKTLERRIPLSVVWELTDKCNLTCLHCYLVRDDKKQELCQAEIESILDQLAQAGCLYLIFTGGEIFTRDDFFDIACYARNKGFGIRLLTNGTLITAEIADKIKELEPISVEISLYGCKPSVHEAITGVIGSYSKTINALLLLKQRGINTVIKSLLMQENILEFRHLKAFAKKIEAGFVFDLTVAAKNSGNKGPAQHRAMDSDLRGLLSREIEHLSGLPDSVFDNKPIVDSPVCGAGLNTVFISSVGEVYPCIAIREVCGDLRKESFAKIWEKSEALSYIRSIKFSDLTKCPDCLLLPYCNRCQGIALLEEGDILGPSKEACRIARIHESVLKERD